MDTSDNLAERINAWGTGTLGAGTIIASYIGYLPVLAAGVAMIWYLIQIWESRTVQHWWRNRQMIRKAKRIVRLRAKEKIISAQLEALESIRQATVDARDKVEVAKVEAAKELLKHEIKVEERLPPPNGETKD